MFCHPFIDVSTSWECQGHISHVKYPHYEVEQIYVIFCLGLIFLCKIQLADWKYEPISAPTWQCLPSSQIQKQVTSLFNMFKIITNKIHSVIFSSCKCTLWWVTLAMKAWRADRHYMVVANQLLKSRLVFINVCLLYINHLFGSLPPRHNVRNIQQFSNTILRHTKLHMDLPPILQQNTYSKTLQHWVLSPCWVCVSNFELWAIF